MTPFIHPTAVVEPNTIVGENSKVWHWCHIRSQARIGKHVSLGKGVYIDIGVIVGDYSRIQNSVSIYSGVEVQNWCFIGPHVVFTNDLVPRAGRLNWQVVSTQLCHGMSIGAGCVIRCGVTIGAFSMIGAGSVVTKSVPPFTLAYGLPAEIRKKICACGERTFEISENVESVVFDCCLTNLPPELISLAQLVFKNSRPNV